MYSNTQLIQNRREHYIPSSQNRGTRVYPDKTTKGKTFYHSDQDYYRSVYLKSEHWASLKQSKILQQSVCEKCGSSRFLDCHHKQYKNLYDVSLADLSVLCRKCHYELHTQKKNIVCKKTKARNLRQKQNAARRRKRRAFSPSRGLKMPKALRKILQEKYK